MFELSVAAKYLIPRWRQLSVSIISLISILVIALVVWLIVVFFSITNGLEKAWVQKLIALTAPVRVTPTPDYYNSYYYQIDSISSNSDYSLKSIGEKLKSPKADPYSPTDDEEVPNLWLKPDLNPDGSLKDLTKIAFQKIQNIPGVSAGEFEVTASNLRLRLLRSLPGVSPLHTSHTQAFLSQASYLGSFDTENSTLTHSLQPITMVDLSNLLAMLNIASDDIQEDSPDNFSQLSPKILREKLHTFFDGIEIRTLKSPKTGWRLPINWITDSKSFAVYFVMNGDKVKQIFIPQVAENVNAGQERLKGIGISSSAGVLLIKDKQLILKSEGKEYSLPLEQPLFIDGNVQIAAALIPSSLDKAINPKDVRFQLNTTIQGIDLKGEAPLGNLEIANAEIKTVFASPKNSPFWVYKTRQPDSSLNLFLPSDTHFGEGILIPKSFRESGVLLGDRGYLSYFTPTASSVQEQRVPVFVAGFYDPGIISIGGKYILANQSLVSLIRASHNQDDKSSLSNGINVRFNQLDKAEDIKHTLQQAFQQAGIARYWKVETYREFEFTKDLLQQMQSDKTLFMLISTVIIIVACSNIISMLIILVNDKKVEIGILRSMGASSWSIAAIFGTCGVIMGVTGSLIGVFAALLTLKNLDVLVTVLSKIQGHQAFNPIFYGDTLPNEISGEALLFVVGVTGLISLLAGIVPAVKASLLRPSAILKSE